MAFMMPVVKNDWDIYNSQRSRRTSESADKAGIGGRVRKVSESRSEGPVLSSRTAAALSPHRSAPAMRSLSYCRVPPSRASLRVHESRKDSGSPSSGARDSDKFHSRLVEKLRRAFGRSESRNDERSSWVNRACLCAGRAPAPPSDTRAAAPACPTCDEPGRGGPRSRPRRHTICDMYAVEHTSWVRLNVLTEDGRWNLNVWTSQCNSNIVVIHNLIRFDGCMFI